METLTNLLMSERFAPPQGVFASLHRIFETGFFLEIACKYVLNQLVGIAALLRTELISFA